MRIAYDLRLKRETFYKALNYFDNHISVNKIDEIDESVQEEIFSISLHIACKQEEIQPPKLREIIEIPYFKMSEGKALHLEQDILATLNWNCNVKTVNYYLNMQLKDLDN